jgi:tryptophanyl-tRNA synthetase
VVSQDMIAFTAPFYERIKEISSDEAYIYKVARMDKEKAQENAAKTIREVREIIGFKRF